MNPHRAESQTPGAAHPELWVGKRAVVRLESEFQEWISSRFKTRPEGK
jgi:hypothetical protein